MNNTKPNTCFITEEDVLDAQKTWGDAIVSIGKAYKTGEDYIGAAKYAIRTLYAYDISKVLFKPTRALKSQFRSNEEEALSYFVASNDKCPEDTGFAIEPWEKVRFENENIIINGDSAISMGNYYFTDYNNKEVMVEYTMAFIKDDDDKLRINVHHSSLPFNG